jgi:hypothetical protein
MCGEKNERNSLGMETEQQWACSLCMLEPDGSSGVASISFTEDEGRPHARTPLRLLVVVVVLSGWL